MKKNNYYILCVTFLLFSLLNFGCNDKKEDSKPNEIEKIEKPCVSKNEIKEELTKIVNWQIDNFSYSTTGNLHDQGIDSWTNATFYLGLNEWAKTDNNNPTFIKWLKGIGEKTSWIMPSNFKNNAHYQLYHADEFCIGQLYLNAYDTYGDPEMLTSVRERADWVLSNPGNSNMNYRNKQSWTWCDALFMAPPVYAHLAEIENDEKYLAFMHVEFKRTYNHLYSSDDKLFFRDDSYFNKTENNGEKVFWGRGNGWVAAGLVSILKQLSKDSQYRPFYENLFKEFIPRLASLQSESGFWHASLLDPDSYPAPETSATALITYAIAYGINNGLLDRTIYCPITDKAWESLLSIVEEEGKLGWVQPIGADPKKVTADMTAPYGVGAFLLAGSEIYKL
ncbi:glycoside hydrolase family 88 protein [Gelidibacter japonicus]|uniref:glycoside hydrolase family 88/105 protein n=1 Tax=Gelidibacter japonicus TaxID=1962232 RepID=UPI002AFF391F|nr:glycoside hydrolase family 88 protein [Gelidibacter japonicus]